jgi:hypothetical protein
VKLVHVIKLSVCWQPRRGVGSVSVRASVSNMKIVEVGLFTDEQQDRLLRRHSTMGDNLYCRFRRG